MDVVVGIDLSGITRAAKGWTVAAAIKLTDPLTLGELTQVPRGLHGDRILLEWIETKHPRLVGIDAPLKLPHSVMCVERGCARCEPGYANYLGRDVDEMARARGGGMPFVMLAAIAFRGIYLARMLRERRIKTVEVYPAAAYRVIGAIGKTYAERAATLRAVIGDFPWSGPDEIDAICAALVTARQLMMPAPAAIEGLDGRIALP